MWRKSPPSFLPDPESPVKKKCGPKGRIFCAGGIITSFTRCSPAKLVRRSDRQVHHEEAACNHEADHRNFKKTVQSVTHFNPPWSIEKRTEKV
jgi:hypothetical protein